jgi:sugar lactone lactonase YvrE
MMRALLPLRAEDFQGWFRRVPGIILAVILLSGVILSGCSHAPTAAVTRQDAALRWPPPPSPARIAWVTEIRVPADFGITKGFWRRMVDFVTGDGSGDGIMKPYGIYSDPRTRRLFVADTGSGQVHCYDSGRNSYSVITPAEAVPFKTPIGLAGDSSENLYITDAEAGRIYVTSQKGGAVRELTTATLDRPTGIVFHPRNGLLYVSETGNHQVVAMDLTGEVRFRFGKRGVEAGEFNYPTDIAVDRLGRLLVTDALNSRIQIFSPEGDFLAMFGQPGDRSGTFSKPKGVASDSAGHIYVADSLFDAVQIFDGTGRLLLVFGQTGGNPGQFWMPSGVSIDASDQIYVADTYNRRIQVFQYLRHEDDAP